MNESKAMLERTTIVDEAMRRYPHKSMRGVLASNAFIEGAEWAAAFIRSSAPQASDPCPYCSHEMRGVDDCPNCGCGSPERPSRRSSAPQGDGRVCCGKPVHVGDPTDGYTVECCERYLSAPPSVALEAGQLCDHELADLLCSRNLPMTLSMSKAGLFLKVGDSQHEITEHQAELVWNAMLFPASRPQPGGAITDDDLKCFGQLEVKTP